MSPELTRRAFLNRTTIAAAASFVGLDDSLELPAAHDLAPRRTSFDRSWTFTKGDVPHADSPSYDSSNWAVLDLPHDWSIAGPFSETEASANTGAYLPTGIGWYRKTFHLPRSSRGSRFLLQFDGVYQCSDVWINGQHLGTRPYGFVTFYYDLSPFLHFGNEPNVVAVRVDNSHQPNLRWYSGSGINRHTWLLQTGQVFFDEWGTSVITPQVSQQSATVEVSTRVKNQLKQSVACTLATKILDAKGATVQGGEVEAEIPAGGEHVFLQRLQVAAATLWSPASPSLYSASQVLRSAGHQVDAVTTTFGIRSIEWTSDHGFLLNGERVKINGVCLHDDGGAVGTAVPIRIWERRFALLKEMGCNAIRASHNPHTPEFHDLCDKMGFLVMAEAFDEWREHKAPAYGYHRYFDEWSARDLADIVARDRNHPSIVIWSAGNEVPDQDVPRGSETLRKLMDILHQADPTRPVTVACDQIAAEPQGALPDFLAELDVVGYNYVDRWRDRREKEYSVDRETFPKRRFVGTENDAMPSYYPMPAVTGRTPPTYTPRPISNGRVQAEQLQRFTQDHDYVAGDFMWTGIDYLGEARWPFKLSRAGVIDTCGFPKEAFYFYQSLWSRTPVLHLSPHWNWPGREGEIIPIICFTNCDTVELFLNGKSLGVQGYQFPETGMEGQWSHYPARSRVLQTTGDLHLAWYVSYQPGTLHAAGTKDGRPTLTAELTTTGAPATVRLAADRTHIRTDWEDLAHVTVEVLDQQGRLVPTADTQVVFSLTGPGRILGLDNGQSESHESYQGDRRKVFGGKALALIQSTGRPGTLQLTASAPGLTGSAVTISAGL